MPATNFNQYLGIRIANRHRDGITIECRVRKELLNFAGVLHGGVTATLADDIGLGAKKNPGGTITYTAVISDAVTDATGVQYTDTLDANTTFVVGSIIVSNCSGLFRRSGDCIGRRSEEVR